MKILGKISPESLGTVHTHTHTHTHTCSLETEKYLTIVNKNGITLVAFVINAK